MFEDHKPSKMYKRASLVIGDKAVPLSVVVEMLPYMRHGSTCQYKTQVAGCGHPCVCGLAALKATLAKDFNITL